MKYFDSHSCPRCCFSWMNIDLLRSQLLRLNVYLVTCRSYILMLLLPAWIATHIKQRRLSLIGHIIYIFSGLTLLISYCFSSVSVWFGGIIFDSSSGCFLLDIEVSSLAEFGCSSAEVLFVSSRRIDIFLCLLAFWFRFFFIRCGCCLCDFWLLFGFKFACI